MISNKTSYSLTLCTNRVIHTWNSLSNSVIEANSIKDLPWSVKYIQFHRG